MTRRLPIVLAAIAACAAVAGTAAAAPARTTVTGPAGTNLTPTKSYLLRHTTLLTGFTRSFQAAANRYYAAAQSHGLRLRRSVASEARGRRLRPGAGQDPLDQGQPVLRARRGRGGRDAVARRVRRDPRRGLQRGRGPGERRPVRPEAAEREGAEEAGQPLQPHRRNAVGDAAGVRRAQGRPRPRRQGRVRRGAARRPRVQGLRRRLRALRGQARPLRARVAARRRPMPSRPSS